MARKPALKKTIPQHAVLSASGSHRWLVCPGSVQAQRGKKDDTNFYSMEGTTAHGLLEVCLLMDEDPEQFRGKVLQPGHYPIDDDMINGVGYALDYVRAYVANYPNAKVHAERRVHYGQSFGCGDDEAFGTLDIGIDNFPTEYVIIDYKHGVGIPVSVDKNTQLRCYAVGARQEAGKRYRRYRNVVVQPRVPGRKPVQETTITDSELTKWVEKVVMPIVPIALGNDAPRVAGSHCKYCADDGNCTAQHALVQEKARKEFAVKTPAGKMTPKQIAEVLDAMEAIKPIYEAVHAQAVALVHKGVTVPGYVKDWTNPQRCWPDEEAAAAHLKALGIKNPYVRTLLSPKGAEDELKRLKKWPKHKRGEDFADPLADVVGHGTKNPKISKAKQS